MALGSLSAAVFSGTMTGAFLGGFFAELFGFRRAFWVAGLLVLIAAVLILLGTRERFVRPARRPGRLGEQVRRELHHVRLVLPVLLLICAIGFVRQFDVPFLPLLVLEINGSLQGASLWTGILSAIGGVAGLLAGLILGRLADRVPPPRIGKMSALGAAVLMVPQGLATGFGLLAGARFGMIFCAGGLDPVFQVWLAKITPGDKRGTVFGWAATFRSLGWMISPMITAVVASLWGVRQIYFFGAVLFLALIPLIAAVVRRVERGRL